MTFVGIPGLSNVMFAVHETTVGQFKAFVKETGHNAEGDMYRLIQTLEMLKEWGRTTGNSIDGKDLPSTLPLGGWSDPGFKQTDDYPVVGMNSNDGISFCVWLTKHERAADALAEDEEYWLPTDYQWSVAAGLVGELAGATPRQRHMQALDSERGTFRLFPWGEWDKSATFYGNYRGNDDGYFNTAPLGSFAANLHGLHDMGGNVAEWCEDFYDGSREFGVLRGAHWYTSPENTAELAVSHRNQPEWSKPHKRNENFGFRVVLRKIPR